jgi:hypothetical protein
MPKRLYWLFVACNAPFIVGCFGSGDKTDPTADPACQLDSKGEKTPGYPYDVKKFGTDVMPVLSKSCGQLGCHGAPAGNGGFIVWADAQPGDCDFGKSFNSFAKQVDLTTPQNSALITAVTGGDAAHPLKFTPNQRELVTLQGFITSAAATFAAGGGGTVVAPPGPSPFNFVTFQTTIQPMLERCAVAGCHATSAGNFTLKAAAAGEDLKSNFTAVTARVNLEKPANSVIYVQATVKHAGGLSQTVDATQAQALLAWIEDAKKNGGSGGPGGAPTGCAPVDRFNLGTFQSEILPILNGSLDLNVPGGVGRGPGCMSTACHNTDRGPGKLSLLATADIATQVQNVACFVNLAAPSQSPFLTCPLDLACPVGAHPGQNVLDGNNDLNYQRLLSFVFRAANVTPIDFAFFARKINPIFSDINSVQGGAQGRSCSDTLSCHGTALAGQSPPNGSDFAMIPSASGLDALTFNFVQATGFTTFLNPEESSLFLYPTNEIANTADHPFATGIDHPGGPDFAIDSDQAKSILQWAGGLRPNGQGFNQNWLVVGDFPATLVTDQTLIDERSITPQIFDLGGDRTFNNGEWDGFFSASATIDFNAVFPRAATPGRVAYAVAYVTNTFPRDIRAQVLIATNNPVQVYADGQLVAQNPNSGGTTAITTFKTSAAGTTSTKLMIKLLQRANDANFSFTAQFSDQFGALLTDVTGELVFTLGPNGGV